MYLLLYVPATGLVALTHSMVANEVVVVLFLLQLYWIQVRAICVLFDHLI